MDLGVNYKNPLTSLERLVSSINEGSYSIQDFILYEKHCALPSQSKRVDMSQLTTLLTSLLMNINQNTERVTGVLFVQRIDSRLVINNSPTKCPCNTILHTPTEHLMSLFFLSILGTRLHQMINQFVKKYVKVSY